MKPIVSSPKLKRDVGTWCPRTDNVEVFNPYACENELANLFAIPDDVEIIILHFYKSKPKNNKNTQKILFFMSEKSCYSNYKYEVYWSLIKNFKKFRKRCHNEDNSVYEELAQLLEPALKLNKDTPLWLEVEIVK